MAVYLPARIVFDTSVFLDVANASLRRGSSDRWISPEDWLVASTIVDKSFVHAISPIIVGELLMRVAGGEERFFDANRSVLRILQNFCSTHIHLPFTGYFIKREIFGMEAPYRSSTEDDLESVIEIVLCAASKHDLTQKQVPFRGQRAGVALDKFLKEIGQWETLWRNQAAGMKGVSRPQTREEWAQSTLLDLDIPLNRENLERITERLDALYYWQRKCTEMARDPNCKFDRARSLVMDMNQLAYLGAKDVLLVTREEELLGAIQPSNQRDRVLSWAEFVERNANCSGPRC